MNQLSRITINKEICHGKPCVRGMRWPVEVVIDMLGSGMTIDEIIEDHPELEKEDILACKITFPSNDCSGKIGLYAFFYDRNR
jgi:uncharacterized protein (DUF433 family)